MNELNQHILEQSLKKLPTHEPPESVWAGIESRLALLELSTYEPPAKIWQSIENELVIGKKPLKKLFILRGGARFYWMAAASILLVFTLAGYLFFNKNNHEKIEITVSAEVVDNQLLKNDNNEIESDMAVVETLCKTALPKCENPEFKSLKDELEKLNQSYSQLKSALSDYNTDPDLVVQLSKLENERSSVLRKMIAFL